MDKEFALFTEFGANPLNRGSIILIPKSELENLISRLLDENIRVLGLDGFKIYRDNKVQPFLEFSSDYSDGQPSKKDLSDFLSKVSKAITHFEVVVDI